MPQMPCTGTAPMGSSMRSHSSKFDAEDHYDAGDTTKQDGARGLTQ